MPLSELTEPNKICLNVTEMPAPEPLEAILDQLKTMGDGQYLWILHRMKPCILFEKMVHLGYEYHYEGPNNQQKFHQIWIWAKNDRQLNELIKIKINSEMKVAAGSTHSAGPKI